MTTPASPEERVYRAIYDAVQAQRLAPGVKLKEIELTRLLKVSRASVRGALAKLAMKGLVDIAPNRGASVAQPSAEDCRQLFEARCAVEGAIVEVLARRGDKAAFAALQRHVQHQAAAFDSGDAREGHRLAIEFHRLMAQLAGNRILAAVLDDLLARMPLVILTLGGQLSPSHTEDHMGLVAAIRSGRGDLARKAMVEHLEHLESVLLASRRAPAASLAEALALG